MTTTRPFPRLSRLIACAGVLAICAVMAGAASARPAPQTAAGDTLDPRTYAPDSRLFLIAHATGVQKYTCQPNGTWLFTDPEATLFMTNGVSQAFGTHFLNFATGRPVWQLQDGSSVETARRVTVPAGPANIPSLLLEAVPTADGGHGRLTRTTWVQRLHTAGGIAPAGSCTPGAQQAVPYTADYFFWREHGRDAEAV